MRNCKNCYYYSRCKELPFGTEACTDWRPYVVPARAIKAAFSAFARATKMYTDHMYDRRQAENITAYVYQMQDSLDYMLDCLKETGQAPLRSGDSRANARAWNARNR